MTNRLLYTMLSSLMVMVFVWSLPAEGRESVTPGEYRIGAFDVLQISVWKNDALNQSLPVRPDGMISLPLVNEVRAAGLTPAELRDVLVRRFSEYMPNPEISVIVKEVYGYTVSVLGEVRNPGRYELEGKSTVLSVLAQAGGFSEFATPSRILILRPDGGKIRRIPFNYKKILAVDGSQENFPVLPGDIVLVP